jgi:HAD superfamily, subfamily IIIB (Acid phosphatase)
MKKLLMGLVLGGVVVAAAAAYAQTVQPAIQTSTPKSEKQVTNIDVLRQQLKNYYGAPLATTGPTGSWQTPLNPDSNYVDEARSVAKEGGNWLSARSKLPHRAIVLDVDDTTLATWNYELYSNWAFNFGPVVPPQGVTLKTNADFVNGEWFPAVPGMVDMVNEAKTEGYAIFFLTGRPAGPTGHYEDPAPPSNSQYPATLANLTTGDWDGVVTTPPSVDAGYPTPDTIDRSGNGTNVGPGLFMKPPVGSYPAYLNRPEFCQAAIAASRSCPTIQYKSGVRAYIESKGYDIVGNFGDQFSDLEGGFADKTFKLPNPNYFLP